MSMDLNGINNKNEYYTNHYFSTIFEVNAGDKIKVWRERAKENEEVRTPWSLLRENARQFYAIHDRLTYNTNEKQSQSGIKKLADLYLTSLGYPIPKPEVVDITGDCKVPVYLEITSNNGAPLLWVVLSTHSDETGVMESVCFDASSEELEIVDNEGMTNEELATKVFFASTEPPRFLIFIGMNQIILLDRNKWNEKRYMEFDIESIFSRREETTLQAMAVLLHKDSLCPEEGKVLLDELDEQSQKNASGVSQDLKFALRESIELLGNEVLYDLENRKGRNLETEPVDAAQLTVECLRYMYRMLFVLFIEARPELGYAPIKEQSYYSGYSLESLRDIADQIREDVDEVGDGYYLHDTLAKLYELIYTGYPETEEELMKYVDDDSKHDMFVIAPLKAHIFDPEYTKMITDARLRNSVMLRIIDLMSLTKATGKKNGRRGRISYANLGINQMGAVYEALLSYRGFIAEQDLYEVKRAGDSFNELDVGYFVPECDLEQYTEDERVRYEKGEKKGKLRMYKKGTFIYRLAGREREKSASYYTPEVLTKCLVKYALKELLQDKTADEILHLTICEPAMGSAAFLNESINQLAEAYIDRKQKETGITISHEDRFVELQKVKMFIADRNVYGVDLNPIAVELAEVSLWLNTIHRGGYVPWFGTQLVNGNSLIGARRQCYRIENLSTTSKGLRWYENEPTRVQMSEKRMPKKQVYHFLLGDPGMANYNDKVIKSLEPENIKLLKAWNREFNEPYSEDDIETLLKLSAQIDDLWEKQVQLRQQLEKETRDKLSVFGYEDESEDSHTTIRQKDRILSEIYKTEEMQNAGPYARLKLAMDYWCALWFWPIDKAELLPRRSEFLFDLAMILEGTTDLVKVSSGTDKKGQIRGQMSLFENEMEKTRSRFWDAFGTQNKVDIPKLRRESERIDLVVRIAEQNKFMHWELEFANLFAEKGGFDLIIGNPPWVKLQWKEQDILSENNPIFAIKKMSAAQTSNYRELLLNIDQLRKDYLMEYVAVTAQQNFYNSFQNYYELRGQQTNLYKCFLPQAWKNGKKDGISAFIHLDGIFDDPQAHDFRKIIYRNLKYHFKFQNEKMLFDIMHTRTYSANVYRNSPNGNVDFDCIFNLYDPSTIGECYNSNDNFENVPGIKDDNGEWNIRGHRSRIIHISKNELVLFSKAIDGSDDWLGATLPVLHATQLLEVLKFFSAQEIKLSDISEDVYCSEMWHETNNQNDGTIQRCVHFPVDDMDIILSGPNISTGNPFSKSSRFGCKNSSEYDVVDLTYVQDDYRPRVNYKIGCDYDEYLMRIQRTQRELNYIDEYRVCTRKMLNQDGERTLNAVILPDKISHINGLFSMSLGKYTISFGACMMSLPYDFYIKVLKKANVNFSALKGLPILRDNKIMIPIICRAMRLNCVTNLYANMWKEYFDDSFSQDEWSISDHRLDKYSFDMIRPEWDKKYILSTDYSRRQALIEMDVLVAMAMGMTLNQLKLMYRIQFATLYKNENDTWYDSNGRIVFTKSMNLPNVGFERKQWESEIKDAPAGTKFYREIEDDTMPGGPITRTIEYVAPFDRCDREKDYEMAWKFFEEKYKDK